MILRRISITGFKSFAARTVIDLERGITGVVGPNGSGKSNIADAIRWALGEQGRSRLRLTDRDEVVFAGTATRPKASFAEVVLLFDNEDGAFPLDLTQVEIARRMYRSGETDYRLAGRSVRLADIQALLASAGVGAGSYAVIGQGMIDTMLMSTPAERKLLFDEAAGIRGPELSREAALRKLAATSANLIRLRDIQAELEPRLASLQRVVGSAEEQTVLAAKVADLRARLAATGFAHWAHRLSEAQDQLSKLGPRLHRARHTTRHLAHQIELSIGRTEAQAEQLADMRRAVDDREQARDVAATAVAKHEALVARLQQVTQTGRQAAQDAARIQADYDAAKERAADLAAQIASNAEAATRAAAAVDKASREVQAAQRGLSALRHSDDDGTKDQYLSHALQILKTLASGLSADDLPAEQVKLLVHKAGRLLSHATRSGAAELLADLKTAQKQLETAMGKREVAVEHQTNVIITARSLEIDHAHAQSDLQRIAAELERQAERLADTTRAQDELALAQTSLTAAEADLATAAHELTAARHRLAEHTGRQVGPSSEDLRSQLARERAAMEDATRLKAAATALRSEAAHNLAAIRRAAAKDGITIGAADPADQLPVLADQLARAEATLEARRSAHLEQIAEYEDVSRRTEELASQITDLESAQADLAELIAELDTLIKGRFKDNFAALAEQFKIYFTRLFAGGAASLELAVAEDGTYGITIKASPAGKRLASIAALSGGERALAGVALVAAILKVNPSPFVVLDEIDAALDEANSGRLAGILTELGAHSQLIVITHNRQTMEAAQVLFGVTMSEHHVSHLLSMRLEQATALAAR